MKLCLGTVQFGMNYGIKNQKKPSFENCFEMLDYAVQNGIDSIDTANAYGEAENVVGSFLRKNTVLREKISITAKVKPNILDDVCEDDYYKTIKDNFEVSAKRLNTDYIDGYMFHSSRYVFEPEMLEALKRMKTEGYIKKFGVSAYYPEEIRVGLAKAKLDIMQFPFSIFDQRMKRESILSMASEYTTEIHTRSAFIQGLITMSSEQVPEFLKDATPIIMRIDEVCNDYGLNRVQLALQYVKQQSSIDKLVFGVDNLEQLKEDVHFFNEDLPSVKFEEIEKRFSDVPAEVMMPSLWVKK